MTTFAEISDTIRILDLIRCRFEFEIDDRIDAKIMISVAPRGYLRTVLGVAGPMRGPSDSTGELALKISIVLPSNRTSDAALARIFELGSLDPARFEVIVRDNSGNARKRQALESMEGSAVKPIFAAGAFSPFKNVIESVRAAPAITSFLTPTTTGFLRGASRVFMSWHRNSWPPRMYPPLRAFTWWNHLEVAAHSVTTVSPRGRPLDRLLSFLNANVANYLYYSALKASVARFCFDFLEVIPAHFSSSTTSCCR